MQRHRIGWPVLIFLGILTTALHAQKKDYSPGYIISLEGDTIKGWIKDRSSGTFIELYSRIRFKDANSALKKKYSPEQILGYACNDQVYESVPIYEETQFFMFRYHVNENYDRVFLRLIARNEPLSYYHWEYVDQESNYLDYTPLFYLDGSDQMVRVTQGILGLKRKRLIEYFRDCYKLTDAIYTKQLNEIHEVYEFYLNNCINP
jgi:hypothetical protein